MNKKLLILILAVGLLVTGGLLLKDSSTTKENPSDNKQEEVVDNNKDDESTKEDNDKNSEDTEENKESETTNEDKKDKTIDKATLVNGKITAYTKNTDGTIPKEVIKKYGIREPGYDENGEFVEIEKGVCPTTEFVHDLTVLGKDRIPFFPEYLSDMELSYYKVEEAKTKLEPNESKWVVAKHEDGHTLKMRFLNNTKETQNLEDCFIAIFETDEDQLYLNAAFRVGAKRDYIELRYGEGKVKSDNVVTWEMDYFKVECTFNKEGICTNMKVYNPL